jgi:ATP adenylyltransferase
MTMDKLWAPWRVNYIRAKSQKKCIFCAAAKDGKKSHVVFKTPYSLVMLNKFPYNNGHLMVAPKRHLRDIAQLKTEEVLDLFGAVNKAMQLLKKVLKPHGFNIGVNLSKTAGAGFAGHLHIHIVPRWQGDTNFMPTLSGTKVISESLDALHAQLIKCLPRKGLRN